MSNNNELQISSTNESEIDLQELLRVIFDGKWIVTTFIVFSSTAALIYSLSLPNIYESKVLLVPTESSSGISSSLQGYSGIASIAGISLPSSSSDSNATQAIEKLGSLSFFESNIMPNIFLPDLMAFNSWNAIKGSNVYDDKIYNESTKEWVRKYSYPKKLIPSAQESFAIFKKLHFSISEDSKNSFVTIKIRHQSPQIAKDWAELIIKEINSFYRQKDREEAEKAIKYLNLQISRANFTEIKQVIAELLQQETQKLTLIEANEYYVYEYIDPPAVMERKSEPRRSLILILGAFLGAMLSILIVLLRHYVFSNKIS